MRDVSRRNVDDAITMILGDLPGFALADVKELHITTDRVKVVQFVRDEEGELIASHSGISALDETSRTLTHTVIIPIAREGDTARV